MPANDFRRFMRGFWISPLRTAWHPPITNHFQMDIARKHVAAHFTLTTAAVAATPRQSSSGEAWKMRSRSDGGANYMYQDR